MGTLRRTKGKISALESNALVLRQGLLAIAQRPLLLPAPRASNQVATQGLATDHFDCLAGFAVLDRQLQPGTSGSVCVWDWNGGGGSCAAPPVLGAHRHATAELLAEVREEG